MLPRKAQQVPLAPASLRVLLLAALVLIVAPSLRAQSLSATVDRNTLPVGESLTLSLTFDGVNPNVAPTLPPLPNLTVLPSVSTRSELSFANGRQSARYIYEYQLQAAKAGDVVIPPFQANVGGRLIASQPIQLKIIPATAATPAAETNLAFVRLVVGRSEVYLGEPFPLEMHLYWQNAKDVRVPQLRADGFSIGKGPNPNPVRTQVGNVAYNLVVIKMTATAARSGLLTLGPAETSLTALLPVNGQRRRDPFDFFGGQQFQDHPMTIASEAIQVRVLPLPKENVPDTFNGAIGTFQVTVTAAPTNVSVGDPITMRIQIAGRGPLEALTLPPQPDWRDFNSYPPTATVQPNDELSLSGVKNFEQVIVPQNHELKAIPPFRFSYFDSQAKAYVTRTTPAIPLEVKAGATASTPPPSLTNASDNAANPQRTADIIHIRPRLDIAEVAAPVLLQQRWFLWLQGLPVALWLGLLIRRKRGESLANNPRLRRQREVAHRIRDGLRELRAHAGARKSDEFFAALFRLLQEKLGERLDLPASAITESVVDERLRSRGVHDETLRSLHDLFQSCNLARYAPVQSSQELSALIPRLESALKELQEIKA